MRFTMPTGAVFHTELLGFVRGIRAASVQVCAAPRPRAPLRAAPAPCTKPVAPRGTETVAEEGRDVSG